MPSPLPDALRQRAVDAFLRNEGSYKEIAERFEVGHGSLEDWVRRFRLTGSVSAKKWAQRGPAPRLDAHDQQVLQQAVNGKNDVTLKELQGHLQQQGTDASLATICRTLLHKLKLTRKKKTSTPASETVPTTKPSARPSSKRLPKRRAKTSTSSTKRGRTPA